MEIIILGETPDGKRKLVGIGIVPAWIEEAATVPIDISHPILIGLSSKKVFAAQVGMSLAKGNHQLEEPEQLSVLLDQFPIEPTDLVVLAIRVVIASLRASYFIPGQDHGDPLREHENGEKVLDLALAQRINRRTARLPFHAAVPTPILVKAISILFPVGLIVFAIIRYQVIQGESIMAGDEIDTVHRRTS